MCNKDEKENAIKAATWALALAGSYAQLKYNTAVDFLCLYQEKGRRLNTLEYHEAVKVICTS